MVNSSQKAFSIRRLNPFNGTLQVYSIPNARALSSNGQRWEIQVLSDRPQGLWANIPFTGRQYFTFGLWTQSEGLRQVPLNPLFNTAGMLEAAEILLDALIPNLDKLPFPLADRFELWLLDETDGNPVALLNSARSEAEMTHKQVKRWLAAEPGNFDFVSTHLEAKGLPVNDGHNPRVHASALEALVRGRGGQNHRRSWYLRDDRGNGKALGGQEADLPSEAFPELPVRLDWPTEDELQLIVDYITWKAPQLLLLPGLSSPTREMLEELAVKNPLQIDRLWRVVPEIHNKILLNKARVEARIRLSNQS